MSAELHSIMGLSKLNQNRSQERTNSGFYMGNIFLHGKRNECINIHLYKIWLGHQKSSFINIHTFILIGLNICWRLRWGTVKMPESRSEQMCATWRAAPQEGKAEPKSFLVTLTSGALTNLRQQVSELTNTLTRLNYFSAFPVSMGETLWCPNTPNCWKSHTGPKERMCCQD